MREALRQVISRLLDVPAVDPDDARRRKLLNILLLLMVALTVGASIFGFALHVGGWWESLGLIAYLSVPVVLLGAGVIYLINRYLSGLLAASVFLLAVIASVFVNPRLAVSGRMLLVFAIPIVTASFLLRPYASFLVAALISAGISAVDTVLALGGFDVSVIPTFFLLAFTAWLAARSLEEALDRLCVFNVELALRVQEQTRELVASLERERAEASRNRAILEGIADGVVVFDPRGKAIAANSAVLNLLGRPLGEIVGREIGDLMNDEKAADLLGGQVPGSVRFQWGDRVLMATAAPVRAESGEQIGSVVVFHDFTREAEMDRMRSTLISIASHDLRSPLSAIVGYIEMLEEEAYGPLSSAQREVMRRIRSNARYMLSMADNLLGRAQVEAGMLSFLAVPLSPAALVQEVVEALEALAQAKGLELKGEVEESAPPKVLGDPHWLSHILINLVGNAIKFTLVGRVRVRCYAPDEAHWALAVEDTGPGIPAEECSVIFEPFKQASSGKKAHGGMGLGLAIVRQLVDRMGGEITVESQVGGGSTFTVTLPRVLESVGDGASDRA